LEREPARIGFGDARPQRPQEAARSSGRCETRLKECRKEKYARELDNSSNIKEQRKKSTGRTGVSPGEPLRVI
jgi:hypothetical protein